MAPHNQEVYIIFETCRSANSRNSANTEVRPPNQHGKQSVDLRFFYSDRNQNLSRSEATKKRQNPHYGLRIKRAVTSLQCLDFSFSLWQTVFIDRFFNGCHRHFAVLNMGILLVVKIRRYCQQDFVDAPAYLLVGVAKTGNGNGLQTIKLHDPLSSNISS